MVLIDELDHHGSIVQTASAYKEDVQIEAVIGSLAIQHKCTLSPEADIRSTMVTFDDAGADKLAIVKDDGAVLSLPSEATLGADMPSSWAGLIVRCQINAHYRDGVDEEALLAVVPIHQ